MTDERKNQKAKIENLDANKEKAQELTEGEAEKTRGGARGAPLDARALGLSLADRLLARGADGILREIYGRA